MDGVWIELVLILVGILANGFFAGAEIALVSSRVSRLVQLRQQRIRGADVALRLKEAPDTFLATVQIAITAVGTLASAVGGATAVRALTPWLADLGLGAAAQPVALGLVVVAITYVSLVLGELAPKGLAMRNPERLACATARPLQAVSRASSGLIRLLTASTNAVLRLLGQGASQESPFVSEEEVRYLVREGAAKGIFEKVEEELVHNVFRFADTTVRQVMVPRHAVLWLDVGLPSGLLLRQAAAIGHSRVPVCRGSVEDVVGVLVLKDLVGALARGEQPVLPQILRPALFVPETSRVSLLLREFQRTRQNLAMVVDEYGALVGLVTLEDLLEEIVGDLPEESERPRAPVVSPRPDGSWLIEGATPIRDLRPALPAAVAPPDAPDYTTVAGFVLDSLGTVPAVGASFLARGTRWTVVEMEGPRIVRVSVKPEAASGAKP
jgi:putative hemolysin